MLATVTLTTGTILPGTDDIKDLLEMAEASDFCRSMAVKAVSKVWCIANTESCFRAYRTLYTDALNLMDAEPPTWACY